MTYLYLLPFKDKKYFKLGISKNLDIRVKNHYNTYDLDLEKSLIVSAKESVFILSLEQELLLILEDAEYPNYYDGYTEVRFMKDFEKALNYIRSKDDVLGFQITEYNNPKFEIKSVKKRLGERNKFTDKHMVVLMRVIKRSKIHKSEIANWLKITESEYYEIEKKGFDDDVKRDVIKLLSNKCDDTRLKYELLKILEEINTV